MNEALIFLEWSFHGAWPAGTCGAPACFPQYSSNVPKTVSPSMVQLGETILKFCERAIAIPQNVLILGPFSKVSQRHKEPVLSQAPSSKSGATSGNQAIGNQQQDERLKPFASEIFLPKLDG